ncbi:MAG: phosphopantothenoylcysteine decarboxylase, partial [Corynebacterium sp.]|uniref:phosphopantothenoylcysteine decarboxylase domain-containing protein n=1 Tax=Corynebacterium sp. TaxID=1720 RepID=UPI0026485935
RRTGVLRVDLGCAGFAAETGDATHSPLDHARAKLARKGCDLLMCNAVGEGVVFGQQNSSGWILVPGDRPGAEDVTEVATSSKLVVAAHILDALEGLL